MSSELISAGMAVIVERSELQRVYNIPKESKEAWVNVGPRDRINLMGALNHPLGSYFKMVKVESDVEKTSVKMSKKAFKRGEEKLFQWNVEPIDPNDPELVAMRNDKMSRMRSGDEECKDNRALTDDNTSQQLTKDCLDTLRSQGQGSSHIIDKLVENSESFESKTTFSQQKFVKKKRAKYSLLLRVRSPSLRLVAQILYRTDAKKIINLREDMLAQIVHFANVRANAKIMVYETNCQGLVLAATLERLGLQGNLVHIFQSGVPQSQALNALNFSQEALNCLTRLNVVHLQKLEKGEDITQMHPKDTTTTTTTTDTESTPTVDAEVAEAPTTTTTETEKSREVEDTKVPERQRLREESVKSFQIMQKRDMDALIIACRGHPKALLMHLLPYLAPSSPFVVFSPYKEPLMETYMAVKEGGQSVMVTLSESWLRYQQVLPDRTHPHVNMSGGGGYLLTGYVIKGLDKNIEKSGNRKNDKIDGVAGVMSKTIVATLIFLKRGEEVLLGLKKRGFGEGKWNGFGGKVHEEERITMAAIRELKEECGVDAMEKDLLEIGLIDFEFQDEPVRWQVHVFTLHQWQGSIVETEEMRPKWFEWSSVPFDSMWVDDRLWYQYVQRGQAFKAYFLFRGTEHIVKHEIKTVDQVTLMGDKL